MVELHIKIRKRIARLAYGENFVSYNEGYKIIFDFDKEWDSIENKTARFIFGENYIDYPFNGNEVEIPLIKNADTLEIGVYSDNLYTTTAVKFKVLKSIKDEEKIEILVPEAYPEIKELDDEDLIRVYDKSEEKIGISPLKKLFDRMKVAIDDALAQAKASGEFDGADGITPTIGDNGNWYLGSTDTGKPSRGEKGNKGDTGAQGVQGEKGDTGATGADGKSAYSYAVDGGYTGTEAEFAAKLAAEGLDKALYVVNLTRNSDGTYSADKTFEEITQAYNEGKYNIVAIMALRTGDHIMPLLAAQKTGAVFGMVLGQTHFSFVITSNNEVQREMIQLATLKNKLPNPYPLTFTGAVNETYDGSSAKTITIPSGGGGGDGETIIAEETVLASGTIATETEANTFTASGITFGMLRNYKHWTVEFKSTSQSTYLAAGYKIGSDKRYICKLQHRNIKFQCEWLDKEKTIIRIFFVGGSGYGYGVSDISQSTNNSAQASMNKQDQYIIADVVDDTMLGFFNYDALTNDILWRVKGVFKYGN